MRVPFRCMLTALVLAAFGSALGQTESPPNPGELAKLVSAVERLVNVLEQEAKARIEDREAQRIQALVSILTIRYRKTNDLESEIRDIESEQENVHSGLTTMKARLDALGSSDRSPEESKNPEDRMVRKVLDSQVKEQEEHLAKLEERKVLAQNELAAARRRLAQLESVLEEWIQKQH